MKAITTTQLRTYTKQLTQDLAQGKTIQLIHRSKIIGEIKSVAHQEKTETKNKMTFSQAIKKAQKEFADANKYSLPPSDDVGLMQAYSERLKEKYG